MCSVWFHTVAYIILNCSYSWTFPLVLFINWWCVCVCSDIWGQAAREFWERMFGAGAPTCVVGGRAEARSRGESCVRENTGGETGESTVMLLLAHDMWLCCVWSVTACSSVSCHCHRSIVGLIGLLLLWLVWHRTSHASSLSDWVGMLADDLFLTYIGLF